MSSVQLARVSDMVTDSGHEEMVELRSKLRRLGIPLRNSRGLTIEQLRQIAATFDLIDGVDTK